MRGRRGSQGGGANTRTSDAVLPTFRGTVYSFDGKTLTLDQGDSNRLDFRCSRKTRYLDGDKKLKASAIRTGMAVTVTGKQAPDASLDAATVQVEKTQ